jgi:uncharacterized protein (DUF433 family)
MRSRDSVIVKNPNILSETPVFRGTRCPPRYVLLDECVSEGLRNYLAEHECQTARYAGFAPF